VTSFDGLVVMSRSMLVGVGQGIARDLPPEVRVKKLGLLGAQTGFDIAKTFAAGELSKSPTKELIPAGAFFDVAIAWYGSTHLKLVGREEVHELRQNGSA